MIPASFAPMILKLILPKIMDHFSKVFKLDKVLQYVEQPNELDDQVADMKIQIELDEEEALEILKLLKKIAKLLERLDETDLRD